MTKEFIDQFVHSPSRFCVLTAPRATGKTSALIRRGLLHAKTSDHKPLFVSHSRNSSIDARTLAERVGHAGSGRLVFVSTEPTALRGVHSDVLWDEAQLGAAQSEVLQRFHAVVVAGANSIDITVTGGSASFWASDSFDELRRYLTLTGVIAVSDPEPVSESSHPLKQLTQLKPHRSRSVSRVS